MAKKTQKERPNATFAEKGDFLNKKRPKREPKSGLGLLRDPGLPKRDPVGSSALSVYEQGWDYQIDWEPSQSLGDDDVPSLPDWGPLHILVRSIAPAPALQLYVQGCAREGGQTQEKRSRT